MNVPGAVNGPADGAEDGAGGPEEADDAQEPQNTPYLAYGLDVFFHAPRRTGQVRLKKSSNWACTPPDSRTRLNRAMSPTVMGNKERMA